MSIILLQTQTFLSGALVVFTAGLMVVTYLYYQETQNHTKEMKRTRNAEFRPVLKSTVEWQHGMYLVFEFENIGRGAAQNVRAIWGFKHLEHREEWRSPLVTSGQRFTFKLPFEDAETFYSKKDLETELDGTDGVLVFEARYDDVFDTEHTVEDEIDVFGPVATRAEKEMVNEEELYKIRQEVKKIRKETRKIRREFKKVRKRIEASHSQEDEEQPTE